MRLFFILFMGFLTLFNLHVTSTYGSELLSSSDVPNRCWDIKQHRRQSHNSNQTCKLSCRHVRSTIVSDTVPYTGRRGNSRGKHNKPIHRTVQSMSTVCDSDFANVLSFLKRGLQSVVRSIRCRNCRV